jgi:phospholipase D1/2
MSLFKPGANVWQVARAGRFSVLIDGAAFFSAVRQAALKARRSVFIMGWDLDSRTRLVGESGEAGDGYPAALAPFLARLVKERPALNVYLLLWDYSLLYATERESFPTLALGWAMPGRVHFSLDSQVPLGASQHQKIVVIDDAVAFSGGLDISSHRWDTSLHAPRNPWRLDTSGAPYRPFHDVQAMVDGEAARALSAIVRERWRCATGETLNQVDATHDVWPHEVPADFTDAAVGIARTRPEMDDGKEVREAERLFLDSIATAEHSLYIENQFFASEPVAQAIARRMQERPQLQTLLIGPQNHESWIEAHTMRNSRIRFMQTFADAGVGDRVRLLYPHVADGEDATDTMIHSKVMVIDDRFLRVGSANLNNRSMGTDTECDLAIEAVSAGERAGILAVRHRLLADHCGVEAAEVASFFAEGGTLLEAAHKLSGRGHSLRTIDDGTPDPEEMARYVEAIADPERPVGAEAFAAMEMRGLAPRLTLARVAKLGAAMLAVTALTLAWHFTPLGELIEPASIAETIRSFAESPLAPAVVVAGFALGGLVAFPLVVMIAATAAAFGPFLGFTYALLGSMANALLTYGIGAWLGARPLRSLYGPRLHRVREAIARSGIATIAAIRLVPIAPFTIVNMVAGAFRIPLTAYVAGTVLGLLPGLLVMSALGHQLLSFMVAPTTSGLLMLAGGAVLWVLVVVGAQRLALKAGSRP